jgi:hypothetical protein
MPGRRSRDEPRVIGLSFAMSNVANYAPPTEPAVYGAARRPGAANAARAAIEARAGRSLSDAEWNLNRTRLLEFGSILRAWVHETRDATRLGNV